MAGEKAQWEGFKLYHYDPNLAANVIFTVIFAAATIGHIVFLVRRRTWYFIPFVIGCAFEAIGYIGRIIAAQQAPDFTLSPYIMQSLLILLGPALLAASIYMVLGRLIRLLEADKYALVRTTWMTKIFVSGDVLSFLAQSAGGGLLAVAKTLDDQKRGENIILGGLGIQIFFFGFFIVTTVIFHVRIARNPTPRSYAVTGPWRRQIMALYASSVLIMVRSVFRMVEFSMGNDSELMRNEVYLLVLDGVLMFLVVAVFLWSHPSKALTGYDAVPGGLEATNTVEGIRMLPVGAGSPAGSGGKQAVGTYDSDSLRVPGAPNYGYDPHPDAYRFSTSRER